jgi:hypothetical protein
VNQTNNEISAVIVGRLINGSSYFGAEPYILFTTHLKESYPVNHSISQVPGTNAERRQLPMPLPTIRNQFNQLPSNCA